MRYAPEFGLRGGRILTWPYCPVLAALLAHTDRSTAIIIGFQIHSGCAHPYSSHALALKVSTAQQLVTYISAVPLCTAFLRRLLLRVHYIRHAAEKS